MDAPQTPRSRPRFRYGIVSLLYFVTSLCVAFAAARAWRESIGVAALGGAVVIWGIIQGVAYRRNPFGWLLAGVVIGVLSGTMDMGAIADGHTNVSVAVVVLDDASGQPLSNARVRALDLSSSPRETPNAASLPSEVRHESNSRTDGSATVVYYLPIIARSKWHGRQVKVIFAQDQWLEVEREGYSRYSATLESVFGSAKDKSELPLPPVTVRLEPTQ